MNKLAFVASTGLTVNSHRIKSTFNHQWQALVKRLGENVRIVLTNELNLNANVESCGQMVAFHISRETGHALLKYSAFASRVSNWQMLGKLSLIADKDVMQGCVPATLNNNEIVILVYRSSQDNELSFMVSYAHKVSNLHEALDEIEEVDHAG